MNIVCNNIDDFCIMITTCCSNGLKDIRLFISDEDSYPNISFPNTPKDHIKFTYVLFTPLYTAIYSDNVKNNIYDKIYETLKECQENCNHDFRIQVFDKITLSDNNIYINKELDVI